PVCVCDKQPEATTKLGRSSYQVEFFEAFSVESLDVVRFDFPTESDCQTFLGSKDFLEDKVYQP
ncbi:hypothetical protein FRX31_019168, partial [Thalictrum thalictroides]